MIYIYNRKTKEYEVEQVAGEKYINWCYDSPIGKGFTELLLKKKLFTKSYGKFCDSSLSRRKVKQFIEEFNIDTGICNKSPNEFKSFNDFFARTLKNESRPIDMNPGILISPGDGRLTAYENISINKIVQVKDLTYSLEELIGDQKLAKKYDGGTCLILRLCPTDYHRFHFVDAGIPSDTTKIKGNYYSVNPKALENIPKLFCENKREWSILRSDNFDDILQIEVGATCVGTIIQTYTPNAAVKKADEKGYFKFGGSTTILFFKKNVVKIDEDIISESNKGIECKVQFGETIGYKL